jgi:small subunit ribosomal protein S5e
MEEAGWDTEVVAEPPVVEVKLFGRWNPDDVQVGDISLQVCPPTISS